MQKKVRVELRIQAIELENYRQYRGKATIDLSCDPDRNFNVLQGPNGAGKTNLLNAITWCLYGVEENLAKYAGKKQPIINDAALQELPNGESICARVILKMVNSQGRLHVFERQIDAKKDDQGNVVIDENSDFHAYEQKGKDLSETLEKNFLVNRTLPRGVKGFFFFDGERLDEFFKEENSEKVRDAILDVSQLSLLDKVIEHLENTISSMRSKLKLQGMPKVNQINEEITKLERDRKTCRDQKKKMGDDRDVIRSKLQENDKKLKDCNVPLVKELVEKRQRLQDQLERSKESLEEAENDASGKVVTTGPIIYTLKAIQDALGQINLKSRKGEIPPKIRETFVNELLDKGQCICGTDIS